MEMWPPVNPYFPLLLHTNFSFKEIYNLYLKLKHLIYKIISVLASLWEHSVCANMAQAVLVEYRAKLINHIIVFQCVQEIIYQDKEVVLKQVDSELDR